MPEKLVINFSTMFAEEKFSGEKCLSCKDQMFGNGFRMIVVTTVESKPEPSFKETEIIVCASCKNALGW